MTKFESFQRQLNVYGFTRICFGELICLPLWQQRRTSSYPISHARTCGHASGPDKGSYYHDNFVRGQPMLAMEIQRSPVNGKGPRRRADPTTTPNFYATSASPAPVLCTHNHPSTPTHRPRCSPEPLQRKCPALNRTVSLLQADGCLLKQLPRRQLLSQPHEEHEEDNGCLPPLPPAAVRTVHGSFSLSEYLSGLELLKLHRSIP